MNKRFGEMEEPMNATERFLYAMIIRQDVVIEQLSSIVEHLAKKDEVATTSNKVQGLRIETVDELDSVVEEKPKRTRARKPKVEVE